MSRKAKETDPALVTPEIEALADAVRGDVEPHGCRTGARGLPGVRQHGDGDRPTQAPKARRLAPGPPRACHAFFVAGGSRGRPLRHDPGRGGTGPCGTGVLPNPLAPAESPARQPGVHAPPAPGGTDGRPGRTTSPRSPAPSSSSTSHDPAPGNRAALCHAWAKDSGKHQGAAFRRLAGAAGGDDAVDAYCAALSGEIGIAHSAPGKSAGTPAQGPSKDRPTASPSRGRSAEHTPGAGQRP